MYFGFRVVRVCGDLCELSWWPQDYRQNQPRRRSRPCYGAAEVRRVARAIRAGVYDPYRNYRWGDCA